MTETLNTKLSRGSENWVTTPEGDELHIHFYDVNNVVRLTAIYKADKGFEGELPKINNTTKLYSDFKKGK
jgi:hypothetical protein